MTGPRLTSGVEVQGELRRLLTQLQNDEQVMAARRTQVVEERDRRIEEIEALHAKALTENRREDEEVQSLIGRASVWLGGIGRAMPSQAEWETPAAAVESAGLTQAEIQRKAQGEFDVLVNATKEIATLRDAEAAEARKRRLEQEEAERLARLRAEEELKKRWAAIARRRVLARRLVIVAVIGSALALSGWGIAHGVQLAQSHRYEQGVAAWRNGDLELARRLLAGLAGYRDADSIVPRIDSRMRAEVAPWLGTWTGTLTESGSLGSASLKLRPVGGGTLAITGYLEVRFKKGGEGAAPVAGKVAHGLLEGTFRNADERRCPYSAKWRATLQGKRMSVSYTLVNCRKQSTTGTMDLRRKPGE